MRLFLYGTLLDPPTLASWSGDAALPRRGRPAILRGWRRVMLARTPYPTLRRRSGGIVSGQIVSVGAPVLARLSAYEGRRYRLHHVQIETSARRMAAWTWIAAGGTHHPWMPRKELS